MFAVVHCHAIIGREEILQHLDNAARDAAIRAQMIASGSNAAAAGRAHDVLVLNGLCRRHRLRYLQFDAAQTQLVSSDDLCAVPAAHGAHQAVGRRLRFHSAAEAANRNLCRFNRQHSLRRATAGARKSECLGQQRRLNAREGSDFNDDTLHRSRAAIFNDFSNLR
jgi:hypothetical protein